MLGGVDNSLSSSNPPQNALIPFESGNQISQPLVIMSPKSDSSLSVIGQLNHNSLG